MEKELEETIMLGEEAEHKFDEVTAWQMCAPYVRMSDRHGHAKS